MFSFFRRKKKQETPAPEEAQVQETAAKVESEVAQVVENIKEGFEVILGNAFDETHIEYRAAKELGLTGIVFEQMLRKQCIEVELVQAHHILVLITIGDTKASVDALIKAVKTVSDEVLNGSYTTDHSLEGNFDVLSKDSALLPEPVVRVTPRNAMYAHREQVPLREALHRIVGETIAYYPPGIPCVAVGEEISSSVLQYIENRKALGYVPNGADDMTLETIWVLQE